MRNLPGRLTIGTTICYINDAIELYNKKMQRRLQIYEVTGRNEPRHLHVY